MSFVSACTALCLPDVVGILGGMGPTAGADFFRLFAHACGTRVKSLVIPVHDQAYPEYWLAQVPISDRSAVLNETRVSVHQPAQAMLQATERLAALGVRAVDIACNTAYAWHGVLQQQFPKLVVLNGVQEVVTELSTRQFRGAGLLATRSVHDMDLYQKEELERAQIDCYPPEDHEREQLIQGIHERLKAKNYPLANLSFESTSLHLQQRYSFSTLIMGCTEIPLALEERHRLQGVSLADPSLVLAKALVRHAYRDVTRVH